ncbi:hypothetical protein O3P69_014919 [Scylla paramamosain]|uniref:Uncharacterized protein n=1 Tax=Scylla paramamosain TaxID=85552 RepID=A0AAW0U0G5_SCYPA
MMKTQVVALAVVVVLVVSFMHVHAWCTEGQTGSNGCNTCTCFNTMVICTRRQCGQGKRLGWCKGAPGSFWMDNCHQCSCYRGKYQCVLKPDCVTVTRAPPPNAAVMNQLHNDTPHLHYRHPSSQTLTAATTLSSNTHHHTITS